MQDDLPGGWPKNSIAAKTWRFVFVIFLCVALCHCTSDRQQSEAERYIIEGERQWTESVASGDTAAVERILTDDFVGVDPKGDFYDKAKMVADTRDAPEYFVSNHLNQVRVRFYGDTAVAQGDESWERRTGKPRAGRFIWTDTWIAATVNGKSWLRRI